MNDAQTVEAFLTGGTDKVHAQLAFVRILLQLEECQARVAELETERDRPLGLRKAERELLLYLQARVAELEAERARLWAVAGSTRRRGGELSTDDAIRRVMALRERAVATGPRALLADAEAALEPFASFPSGGRHVDPGQPMDVTATSREIDAARAVLARIREHGRTGGNDSASGRKSGLGRAETVLPESDPRREAGPAPGSPTTPPEPTTSPVGARLTCLIRNVDGGIVSFANGYSPAEAADGAVYRANIVLARTGQLRREHTTPDAEEE